MADDSAGRDSSMPYEFLRGLNLAEDDERKLRALGARTPLSLLSMIEHSRAKFAQFLGEETTSRVEAYLRNIVPGEEKQQLASLPAFRGHFGAVVSEPASPEAISAKQRCDGLLADIRRLRESGDNSPETHDLLQRLEQELRNTLPLTAAGGK